MKAFIIGATGYVGGQILCEMLDGGHDVVGFARDDAGAARIDRAGARPWMGVIEDAGALCAQARAADVTIFAPQLSTEAEQKTVTSLLDGLAGTGTAFLFTSGTGVLSVRTEGDWCEESFAEDDPFVPLKFIAGRVETENRVRTATGRGVRGMVVRPPAIWGNGGHGITDLVTASVAATGAACYVGRGLALSSHVHVGDLARLYRLAAERGTGGALYHAVAGELNNRSIAELVAKRLGVATRSVSMTEAIEIWGKFFALVVLSVSSRSRSPRARRELCWTPLHVDLAEEILSGDIRALAGGSAFRGYDWRG